MQGGGGRSERREKGKAVGEMAPEPTRAVPDASKNARFAPAICHKHGLSHWQKGIRLTKMLQRITVADAPKPRDDPIALRFRPILPKSPGALRFLKAVCSNPRQKREKSVTLPQHIRLEKLHQAPCRYRAYGRATRSRDCTGRKAAALPPRPVSPGESIRSISNGP